MENKRKLGVIKSAPMPAEDDHGILTSYITVNYDECCFQGFGGLCLNERLSPHWIKEICNTFGVKNFDELYNEKCFILKSFGEYNETIEGLESVKTGKRFTVTGFRRRHCDSKTNKLKEKKDQLKRDIKRCQNNLKEAENKLKTIDKDFTDWEVE